MSYASKPIANTHFWVITRSQGIRDPKGKKIVTTDSRGQNNKLSRCAREFLYMDRVFSLGSTLNSKILTEIRQKMIWSWFKKPIDFWCLFFIPTLTGFCLISTIFGRSWYCFTIFLNFNFTWHWRQNTVTRTIHSSRTHLYWMFF